MKIVYKLCYYITKMYTNKINLLYILKTARKRFRFVCAVYYKHFPVLKMSSFSK